MNKVSDIVFGKLKSITETDDFKTRVYLNNENLINLNYQYTCFNQILIIILFLIKIQYL